MKKYLIILLLFFFICLFAWSQFKSVQTTTPCDKEMLKKIPGRWMPIGWFLSAKNSIQPEQEIVRRLDVIQKMAFNVYPEPMAYDIMQSYYLGYKDFASQLKIEKLDYGTRQVEINGIPGLYYAYSLKYCNYFCGAYRIALGKILNMV